MKYTKGPWEVVRDYGGRIDFIGSPTVKVKICHFTILDAGGEERDGNAQRIVECVNAMEGIDDPQAARAVLDDPRTRAATDLLAACKELLCELFECDSIAEVEEACRDVLPDSDPARWLAIVRKSEGREE